MAPRKSKKNNTIFLIVLLLLLLLIGWLLWKIMASPTAPRLTSTQTNTGSSYATGNQPSSYYNNTPPYSSTAAPLPSIVFSMPADTPRPASGAPATTSTAATSATEPAASTQRVARPDLTTPAAATTTSRTPTSGTTRRPPSSTSTGSTRTTATSASTQPVTQTASVSTPRTPTRPTRPVQGSAPFGMAGSTLEGMAIIRGKSQDQSTGKYYLYCASDRTSLNYVYEVDGATFYEANPGLMYNPAKVANWKFVSSQ